MTIEDILKQPIEQQLASFKATKDKEYEKNLKEAKEQLNPNTHSIVTDVVGRPDKMRTDVTTKANGDVETKQVLERVNRIALPLQQIIVERAISFLFGNDVNVSTTNENGEDVIKALQAIGKDNKIDSFNRKIARSVFTVKEAAEYWFIPKTDNSTNHTKYGFNTTSKINVQLFSPSIGDTLYPLFNEYGEMVAFARHGSRKTLEGKDAEYFERWTKDNHLFYLKESSGSWVEQINENNQLGKIPIVYYKQDYVEWYNVQTLIDRLEKLLSNNGDTNDRHARPILAAKGTVNGMVGDFIQLDENAGIEYVSWNQGTQSIKEEVDVLLRLIYSLSQTQDISFESIRGIGNISGSSLELLFMDAHLKVKNKMELFDECLTRRYNILKTFLSKLNGSWQKAIDEMEVDIRVTPYIVGSDAETLNNLIQSVSANIMSLETAVERNPYIENAQHEMERIMSERDTKQTKSENINEDTGTESNQNNKENINN